MEYKTILGHEIVRDGEYETMDGAKAVVLGFLPNPTDPESAIIGYIDSLGVNYRYSWTKDGRESECDHEANWTLKCLWKVKPPFDIEE